MSKALERGQAIENLEESCQIFATGAKTRDFDDSSPLYSQVLQDDFEAEFDLPGALGRVKRNLAESPGSVSGVMEEFPGYQVQITNIDVRLDEKRGEADVFSMMDSTRGEGSAMRQSFILQKWKRVEGKWWCVRYEGFKGDE